MYKIRLWALKQILEKGTVSAADKLIFCSFFSIQNQFSWTESSLF